MNRGTLAGWIPSPDDRRFILLMAVIGLLRLILLLTSQGALHGDEATVGIMAMHILEGIDLPLVAHGATYNGGSALTAYLAAALFAIFGVSELALKVVPVFFSLLALLVVYLFVRSARGPRVALLAAAVYGTSVALLKWNFDARGAYAECQVLIPLTLWLTWRRCRQAAEQRPLEELAIGLLCGLGLYLLPTFAAVVLTVSFCFLARMQLRRGGASLLTGAIGLLIGFAPMLYYRFSRGRPLIESSGVDLVRQIGLFPDSLWETLTRRLPAMMAFDNLYGYPAIAFLPNWIEYAFLVAGVAVLVARRGGIALEGLRSASSSLAPETVLLCYGIVYLVLFALHPLADSNARYLVFLEPSLSILAGLGFSEALLSRNPWQGWGRRAVIALLTLALADRGYQYLRLVGDHSIHGVSGRRSPDTAPRLMDFMKAIGVDRAMMEDTDLRWRINFLSVEKISVFHFSTRWFNDPPEEIGMADRYVVVLEPGGPTEGWLLACLAAGVPPERIERHLVAGMAVHVRSGAGDGEGHQCVS